MSNTENQVPGRQITIYSPPTTGGEGGMAQGTGGVQNATPTGAQGPWPSAGIEAHMSTCNSDMLEDAYPGSPIYDDSYDPYMLFTNLVQLNGEFGDDAPEGYKGDYIDFPDGVNLDYDKNIKVTPMEVPKFQTGGGPQTGWVPSVVSPGLGGGANPINITEFSPYLPATNDNPGVGPLVQTVDNRGVAKNMRNNSTIGHYLKGYSPANKDGDFSSGVGGT